MKLPHLPLQLWGARSLSKIGSASGKPLVTDECTMNKLRVSYAIITINDNEEKHMKQPVEYEWKPKLCEMCQKAGHQCEKSLPKKSTNEWKPKGT